jgi:hypothetical protein
MKIDPREEARLMFEVRADQWEEAEVPVEDIFHAFAQAFGMALSRYCAPSTAAAFLRQEVGRIEKMAISPTTEISQ